jgi:hypothetical protein
VIPAKGRYRNQTLELEQPLAIAEGTEVEIDVHVGQERENSDAWAGRNLGSAGWSKSTQSNGFVLDAATRNDLNFKRGAELLRLDRTVDARREFATLIEEKKDEENNLEEENQEK